MRDLEMPDKSTYIKHCGKLDFISCNETLSVLELEMVSAMRREYILSNILEELRPGYDFILIDCGPSLGVLTVNALMASDSVLIVSTPESDSNEGTKLLVRSLQLVRKKYKHMIEVDGILMNMVVDRMILTREMLEETKHDFGEAVRVFETVTLRAEENGRYTLLSGCNRRHCNRLAGNSELPAVVRHNVSDGDAKLIITHSNRQRGLDELLPSEKAFAFKMELEGLKETRRELKKVQAIEVLENAANADEQEVFGKLFKFEQGEYTRETLAKQYGLKATEVQRLIRLTQFHPLLLELVDTGNLADYVAVPLTYLSEDMQLLAHRLVTEKHDKMDIHKAELLKAEFKAGKLDAARVEAILSGKEGQGKPVKAAAPIKLKPTIVKRYFTNGESQKEIQSTIEKALELYFKREGTPK